VTSENQVVWIMSITDRATPEEMHCISSSHIINQEYCKLVNITKRVTIMRLKLLLVLVLNYCGIIGYIMMIGLTAIE
jgi:hypothetical protein